MFSLECEAVILCDPRSTCMRMILNVHKSAALP